MKHLRDSIKQRLLPVGVASVLTFGGLLSLVPSAGAQLDGNAYTTTNNVEVTWEDPWYADEERTGYFEDTPTDIVILFQDTGYQLAIAEYPSEYSIDELIQGEVDRAEEEDDAEVIDTVEDPESVETSWIYEDTEGETRGVYLHIYEFDTDYNLLVRVAAPVDDMADAFDDLAVEVEIDGDEPFADIDTEGVVETFESESGGSNTNNDDEETSTPDDEDNGGDVDDEETPTPDEDDNGGDVDADEYLATVQDNYDELSASYDRFNEIFAQDEITDADSDELIDILAAWADASDIAAELDAPKEYEEIQDAYQAYADELTAASEAFTAFAEAEPDSPEADDALEDFSTALANAEDLGAELEDLLADA